jgi:hypothetical protein
MTRRSYVVGLSPAEKIMAGVEDSEVTVVYNSRLQRWDVLHGSVVLAHFADQQIALGWARRYCDTGDTGEE